VYAIVATFNRLYTFFSTLLHKELRNDARRRRHRATLRRDAIVAIDDCVVGGSRMVLALWAVYESLLCPYEYDQ
jgi:hypothetical protein